MAFLELFKQYPYVTYYTVRCTEGKQSEAENFLTRMRIEFQYKSHFNRLVTWVEEIGKDKNGAEEDLFREEGLCVALPPPRNRLDGALDMRWYCHRLSARIVILYNGDIKTRARAQDCPNVRPHFLNSQKWTKSLNELDIKTDDNKITNLDTIKFNC